MELLLMDLILARCWSEESPGRVHGHLLWWMLTTQVTQTSSNTYSTADQNRDSHRCSSLTSSWNWDATTTHLNSWHQRHLSFHRLKSSVHRNNGLLEQKITVCSTLTSSISLTINSLSQMQVNWSISLLAASLRNQSCGSASWESSNG